jgi:DNA polymerase-4
MKPTPFFFHIDVNSAYLAWESIERIKTGDLLTATINNRQCVIPDLRTVPSIVGGDAKSRRGIVLSKSHPCKPYGILTGEALPSAVRKCPGLVVVPARFGVYERYSNDMINYLHQFSDRVQQYSIDEAFLDYTHMERHFGPPLEAADKIRQGIMETFGFTVCVGVGPNKLLAKMATELRKPNFTNTLLDGEIEKMWVLPIEDLFMAGRATAPKLRQLGIQTIGDLARFDIKLLESIFKSYAHLLWEYANGIDRSKVEPYHEAAKSVGNSTTLPYDINRYDDANRVLLHLCESVGKRLRATKTAANVVSVGVRNSVFGYYSHQRKLVTPTDNTTELYRHATALFRECWRREPVRQLGFRAEKLSNSDYTQLSLFNGRSNIEKQKRLDSAIDAIRNRYGDQALMRAAFLRASAETDASSHNDNFNTGGKKSDYTLNRFSPFKATGGL